MLKVWSLIDIRFIYWEKDLIHLLRKGSPNNLSKANPTFPNIRMPNPVQTCWIQGWIYIWSTKERNRWNWLHIKDSDKWLPIYWCLIGILSSVGSIHPYYVTGILQNRWCSGHNGCLSFYVWNPCPCPTSMTSMLYLGIIASRTNHPRY